MVEAQPGEAAPELLGSSLARLARSGTILVDRSPPPIADIWALQRRDDPFGSEAEVSTTSTTSGKSTSATKTSATVASSSSSTPAATTDTSAVVLPTPFDLGFSNNITTKCQSFMTSMLSNATFKACLPFSLLLQNSNSFFQATKSVTRITQVLDASCNANATSCSALLSSFDANLTSTCSTDLASENPLISYAHLGLLAYKPLYSASCQRSPTSSYCFADAITNSSNPADTYVYYLPLNTTLVGGSQPTCNSCLKQVMGVFESATSDRSSALATDYVSAATQVNINCGPGFVNASLAAATSGGSGALVPAFATGWLALAMLVVGRLL